MGTELVLVLLSFLNSFGREKFQYGSQPCYRLDARGIVKSFKIWESNSFQKAVLSEYRKIWTVLCFIIKRLVTWVRSGMCGRSQTSEPSSVDAIAISEI